jgi:hypothetical protein
MLIEVAELLGNDWSREEVGAPRRERSLNTSSVVVLRTRDTLKNDGVTPSSRCDGCFRAEMESGAVVVDKLGRRSVIA